MLMYDLLQLIHATHPIKKQQQTKKKSKADDLGLQNGAPIGI